MTPRRLREEYRRTQLWRRLDGEGRLRKARDEVSGEQMERPNFDTAMDEEILLRGYAELVGDLYGSPWIALTTAQVEVGG